MERVVLDTSALLFWTLDPARLTSSARATIGTAERILVSSISIWEVGVKAAKGRLELPLPVRQWAQQLEQVAGVRLVPVDSQVWLTNLELPWAHGDPADRTIVATAQLEGCPLVTSDQQMRSFYLNSVW